MYYLLAAISAVAFVLLFLTPLDESAIQSTEAKPFVQEFADMIKLAIKPLVLVFIISAFTYVLIEQSIMSWLPTFNSKVLHLPTTLSIQMASILAASTTWAGFLRALSFEKFIGFLC